MATDGQEKDLMAEIVNNDKEIAHLKALAFEITYQQPEKKTFKGILQTLIQRQNKEIGELFELIHKHEKERDEEGSEIEDAYVKHRWFGAY